MGDLKWIYRAETEDKAAGALKKLQEKWDAKYPPQLDLGLTSGSM